MTRCAVITGAGRRLGAYLVRALLESGWSVFALTRSSSQQLDALKASFGERLSVITYGSFSVDEIRASCAKIKGSSSSIELIVNNASIFEKDILHRGGEAEYFSRLFDVHMMMPMLIKDCMEGHLSESFAKYGRPSSVVNITDIYSENPSSEYALYCSTKAGLENMTKSYAKKFSAFCRVNSIQPGPIKFLEEHTGTEKMKVSSETLLGVEPGFEPIFKMLKAIENNDFVTGASFKVDGGRSIGNL